LLFLFCFETSYRRSASFNIDLGTKATTTRQAGQNDRIEMLKEEQEPEAAWTFWEQLRLFRGYESDENIFKTMIRPLPLLLFPQVMFAFLCYGILSGWNFAVAGTYALIFGGPPYNMSVSQIGLLGIGDLICSLLGFVAGPLNDWLCKFMARRNGGIYEPEVPIHLTILTVVPSGNSNHTLHFGYYRILGTWLFITQSITLDSPPNFHLREFIKHDICGCRCIWISHRLSP
jgi:hypothetical protein